MSATRNNIFCQASEVDGRSVSSVRKFARDILQTANRVQRSMRREEFIRQIVTWFKECADGYVAPQLADEVTQRTHEDFMTAVVTASLLLIPDSVDLVNRVRGLLLQRPSIRYFNSSDRSETIQRTIIHGRGTGVFRCYWDVPTIPL